ncbi:MAG: hypothetical protein KQI81_24805, partial [Deltaproteobacteria bacterium]|nr:hypothetical protein [Deltaproteobacteria bacterium]
PPIPLHCDHPFRWIVTTFLPGEPTLDQLTFFTILLPISFLGRIMAKDRLSMRKFKEVLRLQYDHHLTNRKIAKSCSMSHVTVDKYLDLSQQADITWPLPDDINDSQLEQRLYAKVPRPASDKPVMPSMQDLFQGLKKKHVTLQLLWYEYKQGNPDGYPASGQGNYATTFSSGAGLQVLSGGNASGQTIQPPAT